MLGYKHGIGQLLSKAAFVDICSFSPLNGRNKQFGCKPEPGTVLEMKMIPRAL